MSLNSRLMKLNNLLKFLLEKCLSICRATDSPAAGGQAALKSHLIQILQSVKCITNQFFSLELTDKRNCWFSFSSHTYTESWKCSPYSQQFIKQNEIITALLQLFPSQNKYSPHPDWYLSQKALAGVFVFECEIVCYGAGLWLAREECFLFWSPTLTRLRWSDSL